MARKSILDINAIIDARLKVQIIRIKDKAVRINDEILINPDVSLKRTAMKRLEHVDRKQPNGPELENEPKIISCALFLPKFWNN
jgi:hypothetical protein